MLKVVKMQWEANEKHLKKFLSNMSLQELEQRYNNVEE